MKKVRKVRVAKVFPPPPVSQKRKRTTYAKAGWALVRYSEPTPKTKKKKDLRDGWMGVREGYF
jgi:hypothetical protein